MGTDDAAVMMRDGTDRHADEDEKYPVSIYPDAEPTALELAHLLAELNFLRAQLEVLRLELQKHSGGADLMPSDNPETDS